MGVYTKFDELVDEAKDHIKQANKKLKEALDEDTWGYSDVTNEHLENLEEVQRQLTMFLRAKF